MTIVVVAASPEGIVLAADSRTTNTRGDHHRVSSDSTHKVFDLGGIVGIATYGLATIGAKPIRVLIEEWSRDHVAGKPLSEVADALGRFFQEQLDAVTPASRKPLHDQLSDEWPLGFIVAGYDNGVGLALEVRIWPNRHAVKDTKITTEDPTVLYRGQTSVPRRMIQGFDPRDIRAAEMTVPRDWPDKISQLRYDLIAPVTAQDAIDLAYFLVETTIQMQRFSDGTVAEPRNVPGCGGPVQCLLVSQAHATWIQRNEDGPPRARAGQGFD